MRAAGARRGRARARGSRSATKLTLTRLRAAAADILSKPTLWWTLVIVFTLRLALSTITAGDRPDTDGLWLAARTYPGDVYGAAAAFITAHHGLLPPPQGPGYLGLPTNIALALPLRALGRAQFVAAWVVFDALCVVVALVLLQRLLEPLSPVARATLWLVAAVFPPLTAELTAGQRGGPVLLLAVLAMASTRASASADTRAGASANTRAGASAGVSAGASANTRAGTRAGAAAGVTAGVIAGALAGAAGSLKIYPGAMVLGAPRPRFALAAALTASALLLGAFAPLGGPLFYLHHVLQPALSPSDADCGIASVRSLWMRTVGGEPYAWKGMHGLMWTQSPIRAPDVANALYVLSAVLIAGLGVWGSRRAGWGTPRALALTFALGALLPGEVYPYQFLPLLPLVLLTLAEALERRDLRRAVLLPVCLVPLLVPQCATPLSNLWTAGAIALFVLGALAPAGPGRADPPGATA